LEFADTVVSPTIILEKAFWLTSAPVAIDKSFLKSSTDIKPLSVLVAKPYVVSIAEIVNFPLFAVKVTLSPPTKSIVPELGSLFKKSVPFTLIFLQVLEKALGPNLNQLGAVPSYANK